MKSVDQDRGGNGHELLLLLQLLVFGLADTLSPNSVVVFSYLGKYRAIRKNNNSCDIEKQRKEHDKRVFLSSLPFVVINISGDQFLCVVIDNMGEHDHFSIFNSRLFI